MKHPPVAILVCWMLAPKLVSSQPVVRDSNEIATAIASALRPQIPTAGPNAGAKMDQRPTSAFAAPAWTRLIGLALKILDTTLVAAAPTAYTTSINVVSVALLGDSLIARVAISQCRDTPRGRMFGGTSYDYRFHRQDNKWMLDGDAMRGHGDGPCK